MATRSAGGAQGPWRTSVSSTASGSAANTQRTERLRPPSTLSRGTTIRSSRSSATIAERIIGSEITTSAGVQRPVRLVHLLCVCGEGLAEGGGLGAAAFIALTQFSSVMPPPPHTATQSPIGSCKALNSQELWAAIKQLSVEDGKTCGTAGDSNGQSEPRSFPSSRPSFRPCLHRPVPASLRGCAWQVHSCADRARSCCPDRTKGVVPMAKCTCARRNFVVRRRSAATAGTTATRTCAQPAEWSTTPKQQPGHAPRPAATICCAAA